MARGVFISFEGIDQCGKNTQIRRLTEWLGSHGIKHEVGREPGGTTYGEAARRLLQDPHYITRLNNAYQGVPGCRELEPAEELTPQGELFGYLVVRSQFAEELVLPALAQGKVFIADRCQDSSTAYQGYGLLLGDEQALGLIKAGNAFALRDTPIQRTYLLDITSEERLRRRKDDAEFGSHQDRIEMRGTDFFARVREGYLQIAHDEPARVKVIDGTLPREEIARIIQEDLTELLNEHGLLSETL